MVKPKPRSSSHFMPSKKPYQLGKSFWFPFAAILLLTAATEYFVHYHTVFAYEEKSLFFPLFGFMSCAAIVLFAKLLGFFVKRPTDYYGEEDERSGS